MSGESLLAELSISQHQFRANAEPQLSIHALVGSRPRSKKFVGRPWFIWKDDPELARQLNDQLAEEAN